jgi:hypothetical protein
MNLKWATEHGGELLGQHPFEAVGRKSKRLTASRKVKHVQLPFRQWDGRIGPWKEHFGKGHGQVYPLLGTNRNEAAMKLRQQRFFDDFAITRFGSAHTTQPKCQRFGGLGFVQWMNFHLGWKNWIQSSELK